jgi:hypothetical protein
MVLYVFQGGNVGHLHRLLSIASSSQVSFVMLFKIVPCLYFDCPEVPIRQTQNVTLAYQSH